MRFLGKNGDLRNLECHNNSVGLYVYAMNSQDVLRERLEAKGELLITISSERSPKHNQNAGR